jgi:anion-transporting  ArsA/GET3 family ATPase
VSIGERVQDARVIVVCGSGGVGKTSVAAALALASARAGRSTVVMAVDPAKRLATSLGLPTDPGETAAVDVGDGRTMDAVLLDTKRTFDRLVEEQADSAERRDRILNNRFYQRIADTLSGTHEYMAMERLYELATDPSSSYETIVIDTPPSRSALSFLDAPKRLSDFLGGRVIRWLLWPARRAGKAGLAVTGVGARMLSRTIGRIAGGELLGDIAEFLSAFEGMYEGFKQRAAAVMVLMQQPTTAFVVVTAPETPSLEEAAVFVERLQEAGMHLAGVVANRVRSAPELGATDDDLDRAAAELDDGSNEDRAAAGILRTATRLRRVERRQADALERFSRRHGDVPITVVPEMAEDVHDADGLTGLAAVLRA